MPQVVLRMMRSSSMSPEGSTKMTDVHTDQRTARDQVAHGGDDIHIGIKTHAEGRGEEAQGGDDDRRHRGRQRGLDRVALGLAAEALGLIARGHQNGVVHGGAQLNGGQADRRDEGKLRAGVERQTEVDEHGELDHRQQQHGQRQ